MPIRSVPGLLRDQGGMEALEYALLAGLIALAALLIYMDSGWPGAVQNRLVNSAAAGDTGRDKPGNGQCPLPPCGQPPPCGRPPCGNGKGNQ